MQMYSRLEYGHSQMITAESLTREQVAGEAPKVLLTSGRRFKRS